MGAVGGHGAVVLAKAPARLVRHKLKGVVHAAPSPGPAPRNAPGIAGEHAPLPAHAIPAKHKPIPAGTVAFACVHAAISAAGVAGVTVQNKGSVAPARPTLKNVAIAAFAHAAVPINAYGRAGPVVPLREPVHLATRIAKPVETAG